jgi:hypothetical protein
LARLWKKVDAVGANKVLKVELTYSRYDRDGKVREAGEWFERSRRRRHVGEFVRKLRRCGYRVEYFKAAEFQKSDGFIHFHVLLFGYVKIPIEVISECWRWGYCWIVKASSEQVAYASKGVGYAAKGTEGHVPDYMLGKSSATKLTSTSRHFYLDPAPSRDGAPKRIGQSHHYASIGAVRADPSLSLRVHLRMITRNGEMVSRTLKRAHWIALCESMSMIGYELGKPEGRWATWTASDFASRGTSDAKVNAGQFGGQIAAAESRSLDRCHYCGGITSHELLIYLSG